MAASEGLGGARPGGGAGNGPGRARPAGGSGAAPPGGCCWRRPCGAGGGTEGAGAGAAPSRALPLLLAFSGTHLQSLPLPISALLFLGTAAPRSRWCVKQGCGEEASERHRSSRASGVSLLKCRFHPQSAADAQRAVPRGALGRQRGLGLHTPGCGLPQKPRLSGFCCLGL